VGILFRLLQILLSTQLKYRFIRRRQPYPYLVSSLNVNKNIYHKKLCSHSIINYTNVSIHSQEQQVIHSEQGKRTIFLVTPPRSFFYNHFIVHEFDRITA
jgi:hypothetical protein